MPKHYLLVAWLLPRLIAGLANGAPGGAKGRQSPCSKPPELVSRQPLPKDDQDKAKKIRAQGNIAVVISEDGKVSDAKGVHASSDEAGRLLVELAKGMKFKPRPGCGPYKTTVTFNLAE
jgi:hypothetical protein